MSREKSRTPNPAALQIYLKQAHTGQACGISGPELSRQLRTSNRAIRNAVHTLRCNGFPICSGDSGYYYAANAGELAATIRQMQSRIRHIALAKNGLVRAAEQLMEDGQLDLSA